MRLVSVGLLAGCLLAYQQEILPAPLWSTALAVTVPLLFHSRAWMRLAAAVFTGLLWAWLNANIALQPALDPILEGEDLVLEGRIDGLVEERADAIRFLFAPDVAPSGVPERLRLSWYRTEQRPRAGERWRLTVRVKRPNGFQNPGGFDYEGWLFQQGVGATGYVRSAGDARRLDGGRCGIDCLRSGLRERLIDAGGELPHFGILLALAIGDRSYIHDDAWDVLLATGTNHLVAISGLHIGLVGGLAFWLGRRASARVTSVSRRWPASRWGALAGLIVAVLYAALAGFTVPTQRALVMLAVPFGAVLLGREVRASHGLALALVAVLLVDPGAVLAAGFWLSFGAVGILLFGFAGRLGRIARITGWGRAQAFLGVGLLPLTAFWFQRATLGGPLANLLAVPWVSVLIVPLTLSATVATAAPGKAAQLLLLAASTLMEPLWWVLRSLASEPALVWMRPAPDLPAMVLAGLGVVWLLAPRGVPGRLLAIFLLLPVLLPPTPRPPYGEAEFTLLDVGQGLAAVVRTREHVLLFDAGPRFSPSFDTGDAVVAPFLLSRGVTAIDAFIVSHGDNDHVGGAHSVLAAFAVRRLLASRPDDLPDADVEPCRAGQRWEWDGVGFEMLHPSAHYRGSENNGSCVLRVSAGASSVLLSGDIEAEGEWALVQAHGPQLRSEVLVVAHHGSNTSSTDYFLDAVQPRIALVPSGYRNRFGFPKADVLERFRRRQVPVFTTADGGALSVVLSPDGAGAVRLFRQETSRFWRRTAGL